MAISPIDEKHPLTLASASRRRRQLLAQVHVPFRAVVSRISEKSDSGNPEGFCQRLALLKAEEVASREKDSWILGADTIVVIGERVLGKPENHGDARAMLSLLSGSEHRVITGFGVLDPSGKTVHAESVSTQVRFKPLSEGELSGYIKTGEPFGKAGAYAIQGVGSFMVESISGSYNNVVGLPVCALIKALLKCGALRCFPLKR